MKKKNILVLTVGAVCGYIGYKYGPQLVQCVKSSIDRKPIEEIAKEIRETMKKNSEELRKNVEDFCNKFESSKNKSLEGNECFCNYITLPNKSDEGNKKSSKYINIEDIQNTSDTIKSSEGNDYSRNTAEPNNSIGNNYESNYFSVHHKIDKPLNIDFISGNKNIEIKTNESKENTENKEPTLETLGKIIEEYKQKGKELPKKVHLNKEIKDKIHRQIEKAKTELNKLNTEKIVNDKKMDKDSETNKETDNK